MQAGVLMKVKVLKKGKKRQYKTSDEDTDVVEMKDLPPSKIKKTAVKYGKKHKQTQESSSDKSDYSESEAEQSEYCANGNSYYDDDDYEEKPKKSEKEA